MKFYIIILVAAFLVDCFGLHCFAVCPSADLTGDCRVDFADFSKVAQQWLSEGIIESSDIVPPILTGTTVSPNSGLVPCNLIYNMRRDNAILTKSYLARFTQSPLCGDTLTQAVTGATLYVTQGLAGGYTLYGNSNGIPFDTIHNVTSNNASGVTMNPSSFVPNYFRPKIEHFFGNSRYADGTITTRTLLQDGHGSRIFMNGTVVGARIKMYSHDNSTVRVVIYRYNAAIATWIKVGSSQSWLVPTNHDNAVVTYMCDTTPINLQIPNVQVGDFVALEMTGKRVDYYSGTMVCLNAKMDCGDNGSEGRVYTLRAYDGPAPATGTAADFKLATTITSHDKLWDGLYTNDLTATGYITALGTCMEVELLMAKPLWVGVGDSFMSGSPGCTSFFSWFTDSAIQPTPADFRNWDATANILGYLYARYTAMFSYANLAQGGSRTVEWDSTAFGGGGWLDDVIALNPKYALVCLGTNDSTTQNPYGQALTYADFLTRYSRIIQALKSGGVTPVVILPLGIGSSSPPAWNAGIKAYCVANRIRYMDGYTAMKNSMDPLYLGHPTAVGYQDIAASIYGNLMCPQDESLSGI